MGFLFASSRYTKPLAEAYRPFYLRQLAKWLLLANSATELALTQTRA